MRLAVLALSLAACTLDTFGLSAGPAGTDAGDTPSTITIPTTEAPTGTDSSSTPDPSTSGDETTATPMTEPGGECPPGTLYCPCDLGCDDELSCVDGRCLPYACGNGVVESGEPCDDGDEDISDECLPGCIPATCGDGFIHVGVEMCDAGAFNSNDQTCRIDCTLQACGDGSVGPSEVCDDGNLVNDDACTSACALPGCGDGMVQMAEECDDGNPDNSDACLSVCRPAMCGDGFVRAGVEECDDGNLIGGDACVLDCKAAKCGDGRIQVGVEECDDGNLIDHDDCNNDCKNVVLLVGQYDVHSGTIWTKDPPTFTCKEACASIFGGLAEDYVCSTDAEMVTGTAYYSGWGDNQYCTAPLDDDYKLNVSYDCGGPGCAYSAYVADHCDQGTSINYCWKP